MRLRRKQTLMDRASEFAESVLPQIESALESALESSKESARDAQAKAAPLIAQGRQIAAEKGAEAAAVAADKASKGASLAAEKAQVGAAYAADRASVGREVAAARVATLRGQEPEPKGGKLKKILLFGGLLALGGFLFNKLRGQTEDSWQSSYEPKPAPTSVPSSTGSHAATPSAATGLSDDSAGGTPGEAVADSIEEPHAATTPDDPATIIDVDDVPDDAKK
ncbi:hypothetical protein [Nocardioides sp. InS609-2]|uniref:hypothetical protein n=1 Tax=Nocardioides sp. InS609-2 TaxID=2760705 RepID=UPI0020C09057|nr:hypothetical protein [Nocardioides sp. InS609-2]